jgi:transposase
MDKVVARTLRPGEGTKLRKMKHQRSDAVNSRHGRIILLSRGGVANREIAERVGCTPTWVRRIIHRFNEGGVDAITWYPYYCNRNGPCKFLADVAEQIVQVALSPAQRLIGMAVWSLAKLRAYLIEQMIVTGISLAWLREILRRRKIRWLHTKTWKESKDPDFWPKYRRIRRLYRKRPSDGVRLCVDEFGPLNLQPRHGKHHARTGRVERHRATYSRHGGVRHMFGVYDMEQDTLVGYFDASKNADVFLRFLKMVRRHYRRAGVLHIVLDNASFHLTTEVLAYVESHEIKLYFTPTNASWLNRIECQFTALKKFALDNTDFRTHEEQEAAIQQYLDWRNGSRSITAHSWKDYRPQRRCAA